MRKIIVDLAAGRNYIHTDPEVVAVGRQEVVGIGTLVAAPRTAVGHTRVLEHTHNLQAVQMADNPGEHWEGTPRQDQLPEYLGCKMVDKVERWSEELKLLLGSDYYWAGQKMGAIEHYWGRSSEERWQVDLDNLLELAERKGEAEGNQADLSNFEDSFVGLWNWDRLHHQDMDQVDLVKDLSEEDMDWDQVVAVEPHLAKERHSLAAGNYCGLEQLEVDRNFLEDLTVGKLGADQVDTGPEDMHYPGVDIVQDIGFAGIPVEDMDEEVRQGVEDRDFVCKGVVVD